MAASGSRLANTAKTYARLMLGAEPERSGDTMRAWGREPMRRSACCCGGRGDARKTACAGIKSEKAANDSCTPSCLRKVASSRLMSRPGSPRPASQLRALCERLSAHRYSRPRKNYASTLALYPRPKASSARAATNFARAPHARLRQRGRRPPRPPRAKASVAPRCRRGEAAAPTAQRASERFDLDTLLMKRRRPQVAKGQSLHWHPLAIYALHGETYAGTLRLATPTGLVYL
eukprot:6203646-Pleurochrysis_carterae.AAC.1